MPEALLNPVDPTPTAVQSGKKRYLAWLLLTALLTAAAFIPNAGGEFLRNWDDGIFILENRRMEFNVENVKRYAVRRYRQLYTPLPMYSLMLDKALFGLKPVPFRIHNILLQSLAAVLLFLVLRQLKLPPAMACLGALFWAIHPQRNESVLWIVERKDLLCGCFALGAFLCFLRDQDAKHWGYAIGCALLTVLAQGCKPAAAPLFGVYLVYAWMTRHFSWQVLLPVLSGIVAVLITGFITANSNPGAFQSNPVVVLHNLFWYPVTALLPIFNACPIYPQVGTFTQHLPLILFGLIFAVAIAFYALKIRKVSLRVFIGSLLIIGGMLLPSLGLWQYTEFHYCDRYNYLSAIPVLSALLLLLPPRRYCTALLLTLLVVSATVTLLDGCHWQSDRTLWQRCLAVDVPNPKAFQVATGDALLREDADDLLYIAGRLRESKDRINVEPQRLRNTADLLVAHAAVLREDFQTAIPLLAQLLQRQRTQGSPLPFMRGDNYQYIFEEDAPFALFSRK